MTVPGVDLHTKETNALVGGQPSTPVSALSFQTFSRSGVDEGLRNLGGRKDHDVD